MKRFILNVAAAALFSTSFASAQPRENAGHSYRVNTSNALLNFMPELKTAPAPAWIKPGVRLTWSSASATVPASRYSGIFQDEHGEWHFPNGQSFNLAEAQGAGGAGLLEVDIVAVHDDAVAITMTSYGFDGVNPTIVSIAPAASVVPPALAGDCWCNPDVVTHHMDLFNNGAGLKAFRTPYKAAGKTFDALYVSNLSAGASSSVVTDLQTGIQLHSGAAASSAGTSINLGGTATPIGGSTMITTSQFLGMRQINVPWAGADITGLLRGGRKFVYTGVQITAIPGAPAMSSKVAYQVELTGSGGDFVQGRRAFRLQVVPGAPPSDSQADLVSGCNQFMPLAIPPEALRKLQRGQTLDRDPISKITTLVTFAGRDPRNGKDVVVISQSQGPQSVRIDAGYDMATGLCVAMGQVEPTLHHTMELNLVQRQ